jgi:hypothetical protein
MPVADCNDFRGFPHKDFAVLARIFDEPFRRLAGRRAERLGRFPSSRPAASVRRLGTPVEMAETDTKSRGLKEAPSPRAPAVSPEIPLGLRLGYPISGAGNRRRDARD